MDEIIMTFLFCATIVFCFGCLFGFEVEFLGKKLTINGGRVGKPIFKSNDSSQDVINQVDLDKIEERISELEIELKLKKDNG